MTQWFRVDASTPAGDPSSAASPCVEQLTAACVESSLGWLVILFWTLWAPVLTCAYPHTNTRTHVIKGIKVTQKMYLNNYLQWSCLVLFATVATAFVLEGWIQVRLIPRNHQIHILPPSYPETGIRLPLNLSCVFWNKTRTRCLLALCRVWGSNRALAGSFHTVRGLHGHSPKPSRGFFLASATLKTRWLSCSGGDESHEKSPVEAEVPGNPNIQRRVTHSRGVTLYQDLYRKRVVVKVK